MMVAVALSFVLQAGSQTSQEVYDDVQVRLSNAKTLSFYEIGNNSDSWNRQRDFYFQRPDSATSNDGAGGLFISNGRLTMVMGMGLPTIRAKEIDDIDLIFTKMFLAPGFESFSDPSNRVMAIGRPKEVILENRRVKVMDLRLKGTVFTLFLDCKSGLPWGFGQFGKMDERYGDVKVDNELPPHVFDIPPAWLKSESIIDKPPSNLS